MSKKYTTNFLEDTNGSTGSANQVLISTPSGIDWVDGSGSGIIGGPYLPLSGGTMTGDLLMDGKAGVGNVIGLASGTLSDAMSLKLYTYNNIDPGGGLGTSTGNMIQADLGSNLVLRQTANDGDITFQSDDGSGGIATYFQLDGSHTQSIAWKDIHFVDGIKAKFGDYASPDLQIYHDGSDSYIDDTGTGWLRLRGNGGVILSSYSEGETMLQATRNGAVSLYYDNSKKFETTSTGVTVTGQTVSSAAFISNAVDTGNPQATTDQLRVSGYGVMGNRGALYFTNASGGGNLQFGIGGGHASNTQLTITNAASTFAGTIAVQGTGDSYFTGNVGIGTTSPAAALDVVGSGLATLFRVSNTTADATIKYGAITGRHYTNSEENVTGMLITSSSSVTGGTVSIGGGISAANAVNNIILYTAANNTTLIGSERMRITPTGNVGIGVTSPSEKLHVSGSAIVTSNLYSSREISGTIVSNDYYRIIELNGGSGRGKCSFTLQSNGGSGVPFLLKGTVNAVWGNSESSVTVDFNSRYSAVEEIRVVRNTSANKTFVDVKMSTEDNVEVFVLPFSNANAIAVGFTNVTTLPSGDTVETVLDVHDKAFALRSITGTAEVDQFNITNDIKIGVGTPSPIEKIHLKNNGDVGIALENIADTSGDYWKLWQDNWNGSSNFTFNVNYGGTDHLTVRTDGNVGIGLTNPVDRLDLYDSDDNVGMYFHTATSGTGGGNGLRVGQNNANAFVWNYEATPLSLATGGTARLTINATGGIRFNTGYGAGTLVTDASGNITVSSGGGAGGPYLPLSAGSSFPLTGDLYASNATYIRNTDSNGAVPRTFGFNSSNNMYIGPIDPYAGGAVFYGVSANVASHTLYTGGSARMHINSTGNVGIGTTSPAVQLELGDNTADEKLRLTGAASGKPLMTFYNTTTKIGQISSSSVGMSFTSLGSGDMSFSNGTGVLVIENGGNVGIGTTSPDYKLEVSGTLGVSRTDGIIFAGSSGLGTGSKIASNTSNDLIFSTALTSLPYTTTERVRVLNNGNVGIGTTSPADKLEVKDGSIRLNSTSSYPSTNVIKATWNGSTSPPMGSIGWEQNPGFIGSEWSHYKQTSPYTQARIRLIGDASSGGMFVNLNGSDVFTIKTSTSNVGIGTTNPTSQLGSTKVLDISSTGNGEIILDHTDAGVSSDIGLYSWNRNNDHLAHIKASCDGATDSAFISFHTQATGGSFANASSNERMRITSNGNVGIGTSTPLYLLDAAGTIRCTSLIQTSQSDKKENIGNIDKSKPKAIPFKEYRYKSDIDSTGRKRYGVLAEDIENDYPELVYVDSNGDKAVNYIDLLVKRVAELEKELEDISLTPGPKGDTGATGATGPQGPAGTNGTNGKDGVNGNDHLKNVQSITFNERTGQLEITIEGYKDPFKFNPDK